MDGAPDSGPSHSSLFPLGTGKHLRLINQPVVDGVESQLEAVGDAELVKNVVEMVLNGLFGDEKFFADFLVAKALRDELHDFLLAIAEQQLLSARAGFTGL